MATLTAQKKAESGTGVSREARRNKQIPAIIYGGKGANVQIKLDQKQLVAEFQKGGFTSRIFDIDIEGKKERVIPRDVQVHPVTDQVLHADFLRLEGQDQVRVFVRLEFVGLEKSPGIKRGGVLNAVRRSIELYCSPDNIPESIQADISEMHVRDSLHFSELIVPEGCSPVINDRDFTVATIAGRLKKEEELVVDAPAADEVPTAGDEAAAAEEGAEGAEGEAPAE